jgi:signal transduction histidine kinase
VLLLEDKWERKNLEFLLEFGEYKIEANEELLKQVWINLIDNAIKFSEEGSTVELCISSTNDTITVSVINQGSEITPEEQKKIFNKFYQADESHSAEGNGVGLAIVKKVVDLHHGEVWVQSGNHVTAFMVKLPKHGQRG